MNDFSPFQTGAFEPVSITAANWKTIAEARGYEEDWFPHLEAYATNQELQHDVALFHQLFKFDDDGETVLRRGTGKPVKSPINGGYRKVSERIEGTAQRFLLHRIIFALAHGWLAVQIDHANRDKRDNSINNLRPAGATQNAANRVRSGRRRSDLSLGECIYRCKSTRQPDPGGEFFGVRIKAQGQPTWRSGPFDTHEEARTARDAEQKRRHGERYAARYSRKSQSPPRGTSRLPSDRSPHPKRADGQVKINRKSKSAPTRNLKRKPKARE